MPLALGNEGQALVGTVTKKYRDSFPGTSLNTDRWEVVQTGTNQTVTVTGGNLVIATGTDIGQETIIRSKESYTVPLNADVFMSLSQRIANQEFYLELVSVDDDNQVDNLDKAGWQFDGTSATSSKYLVQNGGQSVFASGGVTTLTTAPSGNIFTLELFANESWFHSQAVDSASGRSNSYRRHQQSPNPAKRYKLQFRAKNLGTAPASSTNFTIGYAVIYDFLELTTEITSSRGSASAGQAMPIVGTGTNGRVPVDIQSAATGVQSVNVQGTAAHDAAFVGNPVMTGAIARTSNAPGVANGDAALFMTDVVGAQIVRLYAIPENTWQYGSSTAVTNTSDVAVKAAAAAGIRNYMTGLQYHNTSATASTIVVKDGSTVIWACQAPASMTDPANIQFPVPLRGTAATALNVAMLTTATNTFVAAQGFIAP